jgi:hypothetical protein
MKNFLSKQSEIVAILVYAGVVACLGYFFIVPLIGRIGDKSNQIQEDSLKQESARKHLAELPNIEQQSKKLQENGDSVDILLDKNNAVVLIEKLEKLADSTGNKITISVLQDSVVQPSTPVAKSKTKAVDTLIGGLPSQNYMQMKIILVGEYNSIRNFMRLLENFEYYNDVIDIQIVQSDTVSSSAGAGSASTGGMMGSPFNAVPNDVAIKPTDTSKNVLSASVNTVFYLR